jgi:uncharacterized repeat protein (TIGR01451 family)
MKAPIQLSVLSLLWLFLPWGAGAWAQPQGDFWLSSPAMPTPRRLLAAAVEGGKIYTFGGCGSPCFQPPLHNSTFEETRVEIYDPATNAWSADPNPIPTIFYGGVAVAPGNGRIYLLGGYLSGNVVQEYDPGTRAWALKSPMPTSRYGLTAVVLGKKIYAIGGSGPSNAFEMYDPATDTWTRKAPMPTARVFLSAAVVDGKIVAIGGSPDCCGDAQTSVVEIYDPATDSWRAGPPLPIAEQTSAAAAVNGKVYVLGGFIPGSGVQGATFEYDPKTATWTTKAPMTTPRDQAPAVVLGGEIVVVGGSVHCHCMALGTNEGYTPPQTQPQPPTTADLAITKTDFVGGVDAGQTVRYTITVANAGPAAVTGALVKDDFPPSLIPVSWTCSAAAGASCTVTLPNPGDRQGQVNLPVNGTAIYTFTATLDPAATGKLTNVASVAPPPGITDLNPDNNTSTDTDKIRSEPCFFEITKTADRTTAYANETLTYTIMVTNGCSVSKTTTVTDVLSTTGLINPRWCRSLGPPSCPPASSGDISDTVTIPAQGTVTYIATGTVPLRCDFTTITNKACLSTQDECAMVPVQVLPPPVELTLQKSAPAAVSPGAPVTYAITVDNPGPCPAQGVQIVEEPPVGVQFISASAPCAAGFPCSLGDLPTGTTTVQVSYTAPAGPCGGAFTNTVKVTSANAPTASSSVDTQIDCPCDLSITKTDGVTNVAPGDPLLYTLTLQNKSQQTCSATIDDTAFPPLLGQVSWCRGAGCPPSVTAPLADTVTLPPGGTETYRVSGFVRVPTSCSEQLLNTATVSLSAGQIDPAPEDNTATDEDAIVPKPGVTGYCTAINGSFVEGGVITYTFVLLNGGPVVQGDNPGPEFTDTLPASLTLLSAGASSGTATTAANTVSWNGAIPACGSVTITVTAMINAGTKGTTICNQGMVIFDADGNGVNESNALTDDPSLPGPSDPCCFQVLAAIPALSTLGLAFLALLLATLTIRRLGRRDGLRG